MAGNFWKSSHYKHWLLDHQSLSILRAKDCKELNISFEEYGHVLNFYVDFIQAIGEIFRVRQQVIATAIVYFRRFYSKYSLICIDPLLLSPTCILLASKVEEHGGVSNNRLPTACTQALKIIRFSSVLKLSEFPYETRYILECEFYLVEVMDCCLIVYHPYRSLSGYVESAISECMKDQSIIKVIGETDTKNTEKKVFAMAWRFVNDCLKSDIMLLYAPYKIALAGVIAGSAISKINIEVWLSQLNVYLPPVLEIVRLILSMKKQPPADQMQAILTKIPKPMLSEVNNNNNLMQQDQIDSNRHTILNQQRMSSVMGNQFN